MGCRQPYKPCSHKLWCDSTGRRSKHGFCKCNCRCSGICTSAFLGWGHYKLHVSTYSPNLHKPNIGDFEGPTELFVKSTGIFPVLWPTPISDALTTWIPADEEPVWGNAAVYAVVVVYVVVVVVVVVVGGGGGGGGVFARKHS